jgi:hypothetical protein
MTERTVQMLSKVIRGTPRRLKLQQMARESQRCSCQEQFSGEEERNLNAQKRWLKV